jgi:hypothetical protein
VYWLSTKRTSSSSSSSSSRQNVTYSHFGAADGVLVPKVIIRPVVSVPALTCFFQIYVYMYSQFLSHIIIIEGNGLLPQAHVTLADFGYPV